ncbi:MAG: peptidoglycan DD-metalloendopeptidase family protein, partial [bacterium]|nr:peptidoglycan DD-metalloendopeptidase family protein [bacterium]
MQVRARWRVRAVLATALGAYAQVYFSRRAVPGVLFLAATWVVPARGLAGLVGLVLACCFARLLGHSCDHHGDRFFGFNGLLVGLALSLYLRPSPSFFALLVVVELLVTMIASTLANLSQRYLGLPVLSLPFMFATWLALLAARFLPGVEIAAAAAPVVELRADLLPLLVEFFLRSLAAAFFQTEVVPGILVLAGLLWSSRWGALLAALGLLAGTLTWVGLGGALADLRYQLMELNFVLTAIAVGGIWIVLRPASMLFAAAAGAVSAAMAAATVALLQPLYLPVLALPFVLTTQLFLYAVYLRPTPGRLEPVRGELDSPEGNLRRARIRERGLVDGAVPLVFLPILGRWQVTQGPGGDRTHQGPWAHAWDFEVTGEDGRTFRDHGLRPSDYYAFGAPVVAPGDGEVVRVVDHLEDNPIHEVNTTHCWGNLVIVRHTGGWCSALCHLQKGSVTVGEGAAVTAGQ